MRIKPTDRPLPQIVLIIIVVVGLITVVAAGSTSSQAFSAFNPAWDGSSGVSKAAAGTGASVTVLTETTAYADAGDETVVFVLAPTERYSSTELARLRSFVERGGTLVVAEDAGDGGNQVLSGLGVEMRFDGRLVADQRYHGPTQRMPVATNVTVSAYTSNVDRVMLNNGTVLQDAGNATVLIRTSEFAYLDEDKDGKIGNAPLQRYPIVAAEPVGEGTVVAVSDPSIFINAMQSRASNAAFVTELVDNADQVFLDYSHAGRQPPIRAALLWLRREPGALAITGLVGIGIVAWAARTDLANSILSVGDSVSNDQRTVVDERSLLAYVRREHPDWRPERVRRIIKDSAIDNDEEDTVNQRNNG